MGFGNPFKGLEKSIKKGLNKLGDEIKSSIRKLGSEVEGKVKYVGQSRRVCQES